MAQLVTKPCGPASKQDRSLGKGLDVVLCEKGESRWLNPEVA
jgi:hypothetical protein